MHKRPVIAAVAFLLLVAACGREGALTSELAGASASPDATATPGPGATATPAATSTAAASAAPGGAGGAQATAKPAAEGGVNTPKDGKYVYTYKGEASDPFNPAAPPEKFDGELTIESSHQGNVYTSEQTNTESPGRVTTRSRWEATRITLLSFKTETAGGDFSCTFDPPLLIAKIPIKVEKFPTQTLKGSGNACNGKLDIDVQAKETVQDATGKSWSTWRIKVVLQVGNDQFTNTTDQMQWLSPDLGFEIKTNEMSNGEVKTPGGAQKFSGKSGSVLKSHP